MGSSPGVSSTAIVEALTVAAIAFSVLPADRPFPPAPIDLSKNKVYFYGFGCHMDTQWGHTIKRLIENQSLIGSVRGNLSVLEKYPEAVYSMNCSFRYRLVEEYYPEDYARIKALAEKGQWAPSGSMVEEAEASSIASIGNYRCRSTRACRRHNILPLDPTAQHFLLSNLNYVEVFPPYYTPS